MIENERQYQVTRQQADRLRQALDVLPEVLVDRPMVDPRLQQAERDAMLDLLTELRSQIDEYETLQSCHRTLASVKYLEEIPSMLVAARVAAGITVDELATRLDIPDDAMREFERTAYEAASLPLIARAMEALNMTLKGGIQLSYPVDEGWLASERAALGISSSKLK